MSPFFQEFDPGVLGRALARWHGTPFIEGCAQPGVGVDCVRFVREIYRACGVDVGSAERIPKYSLGWGLQQEHSRILDWLHSDGEARAKLRHLPPSETVMRGDMLVLRRGKSHHHVGLAGPEMPAMLWHCDYPGGVVSWPLAPYLSGRTIVILRLYDELSGAQN
jgi:hypothetical protein